jgi:competence protein ComEC
LGNSLYAFAIRSRIYFKEIIYAQITAHRERAIALALLLGTKEELTPEIRETYAAAGAMHVLAVSGLHVGIVYGLILLLFRNAYKRPVMKWIYLVVTLGTLWSYALITGLSASVLRAVTMFSLMTIAKVARREGNIYNTLSAAGLLLLCYDPYMIMSVGFQLSFLAVFGIVYITPKIYHRVMVDQYLLNKMWEATCVTLAAQISTLPLVLLYFNQIPTYFFLANLVVIPAAFAILVLGLVLFVVEAIPYIGEVVGYGLAQLIYWTNEFVYLMDSMPYNTINDLYIDGTQAWLMIAGLVLLFAWFHYRRVVHVVFLTLTILLFVVVQQDRNVGNLQRRQVVFYSIPQHSAMDFIQGNQVVTIADSALFVNQRKLQYHIRPMRLMTGVAGIPKAAGVDDLVRRSVGGNELIVWNARSVLFIREVPTQQMKIKVDVLVIANNSIYQLNQLVGLSFDTLIIDGSNSRYRTGRLMLEAVGEKYKAIDLIDNGALSIVW